MNTLSVVTDRSNAVGESGDSDELFDRCIDIQKSIYDAIAVVRQDVRNEAEGVYDEVLQGSPS